VRDVLFLFFFQVLSRIPLVVLGTPGLSPTVSYMQSHPRVTHLQIRYIFNVNPLPIVFARYVDVFLNLY
jgi:hypothetical protein